MPAKRIPKEQIQTPKGTRDILAQDAPYFERVIQVAEEITRFYGFMLIQTPHFEKTEIFERTLGEASDIVEKEMYNFRTRGGDHLTLRPEATAGIARAYIQHGMGSWPQPVKIYTHGSFFRHERPQRGRFRELRQFDWEILGEDDPITDSLVIRIMYTVLVELGFKNIAVQINSIGDTESRAVYRKELVAFYRKNVNTLCKDCKRRLKENPLRLLDCKEHTCIELREDAPQIIKYLGDASKKRFKCLLEFLEEGDISYFINPYLVRGLDYYTDTVFEIFVNCEDASGIMEQENTDGNKPTPLALGGGGRYDGLMKILGGKPTPGVGAALGIDRIVMEMKEQGLKAAEEVRPHVFLVQLGPSAKRKSFGLMEEFRKAHIPIMESVGKDSIKSQLKIADKVEADYTLILGQKEALDGTVIVREMTTGVQETVRMADVVQNVKDKLKKKR
ncbi:MAG: histidine--tRNA ligase [Candidatus Ryanbacteria bacterium CG10_big_fil_rev_8_21_14_0_10_43_42]|uniref:Histidine--tRNA ligase n=1 Tax=Candidatus Ryanbacteria bacterium CG10_big_fil_rev_8_21_14_0_10_43_42 TaxID=1974864 RepID=A0A2M8KXC0_9BACT|nr:MAG: histidine--tRNA ligase [Candidatus Ryanbacteria bacterium CG10_big_fil_rev_8_21_14_0_10_43_42]